uniref:BAG domain-containing protein n=1 Tax=Physcomitrium patens TaxID=3218 RepID=A0A7I4BMV8_PHYPA
MLKAPPPSEVEAATTIQAHWRGFMVRRTRPLEKLQIIYEVRQGLKDHMRVLAEPAQYESLCSDPKQRLRWSECAMALLLRLDSVQGAHADVRDIRKLVTKEVIAFQEIIDSTSKDASSETLTVSKCRCDQKGIKINTRHVFSLTLNQIGSTHLHPFTFSAIMTTNDFPNSEVQKTPSEHLKSLIAKRAEV